MSEAEQEDSLPQSDVSPEQLLSRLLDLVGDARSIADITFDRVADAMGLPLQTLDTGGWGYGARLSEDWSFGLEYSPDSVIGGVLYFDFQTTGAIDEPLVDIDYLDFDAFANSLRGSGYLQDAAYGVSTEERFTRSGLLLRIQTRGDGSDLPDQTRRRYVQAVSIQPNADGVQDSTPGV